MSTGIQLRLEDVHAGYQRDVDVLNGVTLETAGRAVSLVIGPNGAGKSTTLKSAFGFLPPHRGVVTLGDKQVQSLRPHEIKRMGVSYIPQGLNIFPQLTVEENLRMGAWTFRRDRHRLREQLDRIYELFPVLHQRRGNKANELSGGQAKMLSISKEVITEPAVMLVDEPTAGLSPNISAQVYDFLVQTREAFGAQILLVDQQIEDALRIADYVYVLDLGKVKAEGPVSDFQGDRVRLLIREALYG